MSLVEDFAELFQGRTDAYGTEDGGCDRILVLWGTAVTRHLDGYKPLGVYPMVPIQRYESGEEWTDWRVMWGCVDLDVKKEGKRRYDYETEADAHTAAQNLVRALQALGITGWIERTRSGGRHVWVFAREWVPAATMRRALLVACNLVDVPPSEVNPKNESFDSPDTLGNYVRLPYPGSAEVGDRTVYNVSGGAHEWLTVLAFVGAALATRARTEDLDAAAALWQPPAPPVQVKVVASVGSLDGMLPERIRKQMNGLAYTVWRDGHLQVSDRSRTLYTLAAACADSQMSHSDTFIVLSDLDDRLGKFVGRPDRDKQLIRIIERAFS